MEKSIENIWNQGFLDEGALVAPKINKLYEAKSINTIDKFRSMCRKNYWFIWLILAVNLVGGYAMANIYLALYMAALFIPTLVLSKKQIKRMDAIDANESSYLYLKTFDNWLQKMIDDFRVVYRFFYPLYFVGMVWFLSSIDTGEAGDYIPFAYRILDSEEVFKIGGIPVIWVSSVLLLTAIIAYFSPKIYMFDIRLVYGRLMDRLSNMLKEMEELRA
ncbi:MAG: hypothetical protein ACI9GM_000312 [Salibacteraceae bacterium]|jgi:hypothetical protein